MTLRVARLQVMAIAASVGVLACSNQAPPVPPSGGEVATSAGSSASPTTGGPAAQLADLLKDWREQKDTMVKLAEAMPADKYAYKPTPAQRTYGEQILHVAVGNVEIMKLLSGTREPPVTIKHRTSEASASVSTKEEIVKALSDAYDFGAAILAEQTPESINMRVNEDIPFFGASTRGRVVWLLLAHAMDIYGQMVVYVRLNGIVPPASRGI